MTQKRTYWCDRCSRRHDQPSEAYHFHEHYAQVREDDPGNPWDGATSWDSTQEVAYLRHCTKTKLYWRTDAHGRRAFRTEYVARMSNAMHVANGIVGFVRWLRWNYIMIKSPILKPPQEG